MTFYSKNKTEEDSSHMSLNKIVPMVTQKEYGTQMTIRKLNQQETHALKVELLLKEVSSVQTELETMKEKCKDIEKENFKMVQEGFEYKNTITNLEGANTQMMVQLQIFQRQIQQFQFQMHHHHQQQHQQQKPMQVMMPIAQQVLVPNRTPQMMPQTYYAMPQPTATGNISQNSPQMQQHHGGGTQFSSYNNNPQQQNYNNNPQKTNNNGERNNKQSSNKNYKSNKGRRAYDSRRNKRDTSSSNYNDRRNKRNNSNNDRRNKRNNSNNDRRPREQQSSYRKEALLNPNSPPVPVSADHDQTIYPPTHHKKSPKIENPSPSIFATDNEKRMAKFVESPSISSSENEKVIKPTVVKNVRPAAKKKTLESKIDDKTLQSKIPFVSTPISSGNVVDSFTAPSISKSMLLKTQPIISNPGSLVKESFTTSTTVLPRLLKAASSSNSYKSEFFGSGSWKTLETSTPQEPDLIEQPNNPIVEELKPTAVKSDLFRSGSWEQPNISNVEQLKPTAMNFFSSASWPPLETSTPQKSDLMEQPNNDDVEELKPNTVDFNLEKPDKFSE